MNFTSFFLHWFFFSATMRSSWDLVRLPGIEPGCSAVKAQSPNHWTIRECPLFTFFIVATEH